MILLLLLLKLTELKELHFSGEQKFCLETDGRMKNIFLCVNTSRIRVL
jgi:hypothetical protein